jgi:hypothetical protein
MNHEKINEGILNGSDLYWSRSGKCGFLKRADGEFIPWVSDDIFKREKFKKELAETFQIELAMNEVLDAELLNGVKFSDELWLGTTIMLETGGYIPMQNEWIPKVGGYFLIRDPAISDENMFAAYNKRWWQFWKKRDFFKHKKGRR